MTIAPTDKGCPLCEVGIPKSNSPVTGLVPVTDVTITEPGQPTRYGRTVFVSRAVYTALLKTKRTGTKRSRLSEGE